MLKLLEENIRENSGDLGLRRDIYDQSTVHEKKKINWASSKLKFFCSSKDTQNIKKDKLQKIFAILMPDEGLVSRIDKGLLRKEAIQFKNWQETETKFHQ